jgi:hypothetical protein
MGCKIYPNEWPQFKEGQEIVFVTKVAYHSIYLASSSVTHITDRLPWLTYQKKKIDFAWMEETRRIWRWLTHSADGKVHVIVEYWMGWIYILAHYNISSNIMRHGSWFELIYVTWNQLFNYSTMLFSQKLKVRFYFGPFCRCGTKLWRWFSKRSQVSRIKRQKFCYESYVSYGLSLIDVGQAKGINSERETSFSDTTQSTHKLIRREIPKFSIIQKSIFPFLHCPPIYSKNPKSL